MHSLNLRDHQDVTGLYVGKDGGDPSLLCCSPQKALQLVLSLSFKLVNLIH